ncbi:TetR/AcrR family transcriptional regulator [Agromyces intestinalis]|uniref:TetR/AcrR family transcriptional regulator n=1 Tax=Agromyces intestinalis TaxID=2592652 RepID=A0A5C1YJQ8_9MICO|nr:TetR/AcrR family transcriptional regulator [Agromyces intestinalis]
MGPKAGPANRRALIAAAREVFHDEGFGAPLSAVAKRAGVGQGSLYRHFPDRMALAVAVFDENLAQAEERMDAPDATLDAFFDVISAQALGSTAMIEAIASHRDDERAVVLSTRLGRIVEHLREREVAAGRVAAHVTADDIVVGVSMLGLVVAQAPEADRERVSAQARAILHAAFAAS